jgi:hypothetical protein
VRARLELAPTNGDRGSGRERNEELVTDPSSEGAIEITLRSEEEGASALGHLVSAAAARAGLPVDRLEEAAVAAEALAGAALDGHSSASRVRVLIDTTDAEDPRLRLRLGPLDSGAGTRLLRDVELPEIGSPIAKLADSVRVEPGADGATEIVEIGFRGRADD